jgi:hypothetical protein
METSFEMRVKDTMNALINRHGAFEAWMVSRQNRQAYEYGTEYIKPRKDMFELYREVEYRLYEYLKDSQDTEYMSYLAMCKAMTVPRNSPLGLEDKKRSYSSPSVKEEKMQYNNEYWENRIDDNVPERVKNAIKRVYAAYPAKCLPQGLSDPMYIMNVICLELGVGDGQGNFNLPEED